MPIGPPRIPPASLDTMTDAQKKILGTGWSKDLNYCRVLIQHPELFRAYNPLIAKTIPYSDLPARDRQILVLRTLALCNEVYEATHHEHISHNAGLTDADIEAARTNGPGLSPFEKTLVKAADELVRDAMIGDATWKALAERYSQIQLMEVVAVVGCYKMLAMIMKTYGIQLEDEATLKRFQEQRGYT
jgi:alkylhydroperoxidase family enzyme